jgi:hypothetical protein
MNEQLSIYDVISDNGDPSLMDSISERKQAAIDRFLKSGEHQPIACINSYSPGRRNKKYYRLSYFQNRKTKHVHVPGGNVNSQLANYRAGKLQEMINRGAELDELLAALVTYRGGGEIKEIKPTM